MSRAYVTMHTLSLIQTPTVYLQSQHEPLYVTNNKSWMATMNLWSYEAGNKSNRYLQIDVNSLCYSAMDCAEGRPLYTIQIGGCSS